MPRAPIGDATSLGILDRVIGFDEEPGGVREKQDGHLCSCLAGQDGLVLWLRGR